MDLILSPLLLVHELFGYLTVFLVGPATLLTWRHTTTHRRWGQAYVAAMLMLYVSGTPRTFYFQEWLSWGLARNFTFNLFGILQVLIGYRAVAQWRSGERRWVDHPLMALYAVNAAAMILVGLRDLPVFIIGWFAIVVAVIDVVELRGNTQRRQTHMRRHLRHMFGSYYYLLTVLSIVHLPLGHDVKWLICGVFGMAVWLTARLKKRTYVSSSVYGALTANVCLGIFVLLHDVVGLSRFSTPQSAVYLEQKSFKPGFSR